MPFNALAKLRDDKAIPEGRDWKGYVEQEKALVKQAGLRFS